MNGNKRGQPCSIKGCRKLTVGRGWCGAHYSRWWLHGNPLAGRTPEGEPRKFLEMTAKSRSNKCIIWPYARFPNGYAHVTINGRVAVGSRAVCELAHGAPPTPKHEAAHSCGNGHGGCITPQHLRWATKAENHADKIIHGTSNRGERHGIAKLTERKALEIFGLAKSGRFSQSAIAERFDISQTVVSSINRGTTWGWLTGASS